MRCKEFNRLLNELHSRETTGAERQEMEAHRGSCERCASVWQAERLLRAMVVPPTPPTLLERICAFIDELAAGTILPFPGRGPIIVASLVLAGAAAAAAQTLVILERIDVFEAASRAAVAPITFAELEDESAAFESRAADTAGAGGPPALSLAFNRVTLEVFGGDAPAPADSFAPAPPETEVDHGYLEQPVGARPEVAQAVAEQPTVAPPQVEQAVIQPPDVVPPPVARADFAQIDVERPDVAEPESAGPETAIALASPVPEQPEAEVPSAAPVLTRDWFETRAEIDLRIAASEFEAAAELGEALVEQMRSEFGTSSSELADARMLYARVLRDKGDYVEAEIAMVDAIDVLAELEADGGRERSDPNQLIDALLSLGDTYDLIGEHELALATYEEARAIGRRRWGLQNLDQIDIIERMTESYVSAGAIGKAEELQLELLKIVLLVFGEASEEAVEALQRYARWLRQHAEPGPRKLRNILYAYTDAQRIIDQHIVPGDPTRGIQLLLAHASEVLTGGPAWGVQARGVSWTALRSARQTYRSQNLDNPLLHATIARDGGDWSVLFGSRTYTFRLYREAWLTLGRLPNGAALREKWFAPLTVIYAAAVDSRALSKDPDAPEGHVAMTFTIDISGRARDIEVIESDPPGLLDSAARRRVAGSRFRPRLVDGEAVDSRDTIHWEFRYDADRLSARR